MKVGPTTYKAILDEYVASELSIAKLAEKHQVPLTALKFRAQKEKWGPQREIYQENQRQMQRLELEKLSMDSFKARAGQFLESLAADCETSLSRVQTTDSSIKAWDYGMLAIREHVMSSLQRRGRTAFGLDQPQCQSSLHVHIGRDASTAPKQLAEDSTVIDVSTEAIEGEAKL